MHTSSSYHLLHVLRRSQQRSHKGVESSWPAMSVWSRARQEDLVGSDLFSTQVASCTKILASFGPPLNLKPVRGKVSLCDTLPHKASGQANAGTNRRFSKNLKHTRRPA